MNFEKDNSSVQVAVRIRPLIESEKHRGCRDILEVYPALHQIQLKDSDKAFTFNYVCGNAASQDTFYNMCVQHMIDNLFKGYNLTILAYGQTGSGKTHSMGTTYNGEGEMGVIPRAIHDIFSYVNDNFAYDFTITVSFMELYQEILYDLLASKPREQCVVEIREDPKGCIVIPGLTEQLVTSAGKALDYLGRGSQGRVTGSTNMNAQSSRSHAIFTITICMQRKDDSNQNKTAKFHLVDLAGSERSKKTGATGLTFQEGVNINKGLLALGNVISALGSEKQQSYVGYRDSNLTRLLKDSLGGNSITLMIACVSPADYNLEETLSTLRYADRARKIKNKPVINQDPKTAEINRLNKLVQQLRMELIGQGGPIISQAELEQFKRSDAAQKTKIQELTMQLSTTLNENTGLYECIMLMKAANERMGKKLLELKEEYNITVNNINESIQQNNPDAVKDHFHKLHIMQDLFTDIEVERLKTEDEIRRHECSNSTTNIVGANLSTELEFTEQQESHTKQQMALNCELQEVTKMLAMKEHLAQQILANAHHMVDYNALAENEAKISALEKEKDELIQQLKNAQVQGVGSKIAEQRRKRVQELEKELQELHKKITEQARLIKLKDKDEQKIKLLNTDIQQMKQTKVKLIKSMKQESEKFRSWKLQRERELLKLKEQDRKRQNQLVKMETMLSRQQTVFKRKVEEAAAINKRLKDALALRKVAQDQKNSGKIERIGPWIQEELDIFVNTIDAQATLDMLLDHRAMLHQQLEEVKSNPGLGESPQIRQLEEEIDLRSTQIQGLQQKILDSDQDNKTRSRWDHIQSMAEAKFALKTLFDLTADIRRKAVNNETIMAELQSNLIEVNQAVAAQNLQIKSISAENRLQLSNMAKEYEEKIAVLLRQLRGVPVEGAQQEVQERCAIQQQALEQNEKELEELHHKYSQLKAENNDLNQRLEEIKQPVTIPGVIIGSPKSKKKKPNSSLSTHAELEHEENVIESKELDSSIDEDDPDADPDWRKTPLARRIQKIRNASTASTSLFGDRLTVKRASDGSCACRTNCSKRSCGCKKVGKSCSPLCKCSDELCENQNTDKENLVETSDEQRSSLEDDDSFKRPRLPLVNTRKRNIRIREIFDL